MTDIPEGGATHNHLFQQGASNAAAIKEVADTVKGMAEKIEVIDGNVRRIELVQVEEKVNARNAAVDVAGLKADRKWLVITVLTIATAVIGALLTALSKQFGVL